MDRVLKILPLISWCLLGIGALGAGFYIMFRFEYIESAVNPETVKEFARMAAIQNTKREARWCLAKIVLTNSDNSPLNDNLKGRILACAD